MLNDKVIQEQLLPLWLEQPKRVFIRDAGDHVLTIKEKNQNHFETKITRKRWNADIEGNIYPTFESAVTGIERWHHSKLAQSHY
jgi:hypothetical protein